MPNTYLGSTTPMNVRGKMAFFTTDMGKTLEQGTNQTDSSQLWLCHGKHSNPCIESDWKDHRAGTLPVSRWHKTVNVQTDAVTT